MESSRKVSGGSVLLAVVLACVGAASGIMVGVRAAAAADTSPVWLGPAVVMGVFALLVVGVLWMPALRRSRAH